MAVLTDELNLPRDTTVDEIAKDATLQDTNTALSLLAKDTTLSAINTALDALAKDTSVQGITTAMSAINTALAALASLAKDTTLQATNTALGSLAKDTSLQAVGTALADVATNTTLGATNTALGSLAKDTSLQAVNTALGSLATDLTLGATNTALGNVITELQAIATAISQSGGSSDYEQLSNRPQINSTVLSGNKTGSALGLSDAADISGLVLSGTTNTTGQSIASGTYFYLNGDLVKAIAAIANGATFTLNTNYEIVTVGSELSTLNSALSTLNSRIDIIGERVHSEGYTPYTVQNTGIINQITIPENGTYLFTAYIRGAGCWFVKNGAFFPNSGGLVVEPDSTSYSAIWVLNAGDVITQANHTGSAQTYTASEMSAIRLK